ncbi:MAG: hypothetical protein JWR24_3425 [Actinoallomurus sp.]|jgi:hypothetical protein|nr:hypothetical protein [Actinoallomurus sp.]
MTTPDWRKSSRSNAQGGDCVEVAPISAKDAKQLAR